MRFLGLCCLLLSESLLLVRAHPVAPAVASPGTNDIYRQEDVIWFKYMIGLLGLIVTALTLVSCLCCRRNRPKGFQEFKNGSSIENDATLPQMQGLELQVPVTLTEQVQFEPLPVERFVPDICVSPRPKPPPPTPSVFEDENESDQSTLQDSCREWFQKTDLHVPREKLKYLREIGQGWFGKVVEGCADLPSNIAKPNAKPSNVVVRILTEEASAKEKAWFLGEATPYFKLRHRNILSLFGSCLETDPYLLLFESCPLGDLKGFLRTNRDPQSQKALIKENIPTRIAIEIGAGLRHMHEHGLAHTDLSARNCLVASDLSIKLGDYGTGVEKYPGDYYVLGDRALPIRWSAPESVDCTETTIETREITPRANLWSYAVLLWEIATWGERPYDDLGDEKVIEMLLSSKSGMKTVGSQLLLQNCENYASNLVEATKTCLILEPEKRLPLEKVRHILIKDQLESETSDFEQRWETLRPNISREQPRSASLQDLRGSLDSEQWPSLTQTSFRLGPEEPVKNVPGGITRVRWPFRDSDSETEEESWRGRVERGAYTEKVKQKSKSVADLMVLVHIEPDSDADLSLGPQSFLQMQLPEKNLLTKKRIATRGSDGDLPSAIFDDQFDLALRKLKDPLAQSNSLRGLKSAVTTSNSSEKPKLMTLTMDQGQHPILRFVYEPKSENIVKEDLVKKSTIKPVDQESALNTKLQNEHILRLLTKDDLNESLLHCDGKVSGTSTSDLKKKIESQTDMAVSEYNSVPVLFPNNVQVTDLDEDINDTRLENESNENGAKADLDDIHSWNNTLETALDIRTTNLDTCTTPSPINKIESNNEETITPSPQSRAEYSAEDVEDEFSNNEDLPGLSKKHLPIDEEDDRKRMSTPDDERSSDSGFRDKESCEEEESPLPGPLPNLVASQPNTPKSMVAHDSAEEEQLRILFELDTILDAECCGTLNESLDPNVERTIIQQMTESVMSNMSEKEIDFKMETSETVQSSSETTGETEKEVIQFDKSSSDEANLSCSAFADSQHLESDFIPVDPSHRAALLNEDLNSSGPGLSESSSWPCLVSMDNNDDDDNSIMSTRSDNSYVPFGMDEEFVTAIRNELREKLPHAQMTVVETQEPHDDDEPSLVSDVDIKTWDDELDDELSNRSGVGIAIRYNTFGTPLSPILEERESAGNSESANVTKDDSRDVSTASRGGNSLSEDDVLLIDTQTNRATLVEGISSHLMGSQELLNRDMSDEDQLIKLQFRQQQNRSPYSLDRRFGSGAPLPSPEDETCKWQQQLSTLPMLPPQLQENLMSTSFTSDQDWDSEDEGHSECLENDEGDDDDDEECEGGTIEEDNEEDDEDEEDSSSSGEFVWQQYGAGHPESHETENLKKEDLNVTDKTEETDEGGEEDEDFETEDDEEEEEEFTPSAWDATLAPHRSALRSPDKSMRTGDQKKSVWFKKQRYHCVYEYPKETPSTETQSPKISAWEPTSYTDWEEMIDNIDRLNFQPMDYFETSNTRGDEEFFVSSSNRPFQFQSGNGKFVSQFFPGASGSGSSTALQESPSNQESQNEEATAPPPLLPIQPQQLGELRHTRDRLKLNLTSSSSNGGNKLVQLCNPAKQGIIFDVDEDDENKNETKTNINTRDEENNIKMVKDTAVESRSESCEDKEEKALINESPIAQQQQQPSTLVKTSPPDGQTDSPESKSNRDLD